MGTIRGHKCAVGGHKLQGSGIIVSDKRHIDFIRKIHADFIPSYAICENCYKGIVNIYNDKYRRAVELRKRKTLTASSLECSADSIDKLVSKTPRNPSFRSIVKGADESRQDLSSRPTLNSSSNNTSSLSNSLSQTVVQANASNVMPAVSQTSTQSSLDQGPTTSAAAAAVAAARRKRKLPAYIPHIVADDDDDESDLSPNALNGTRLPHIQPIPKRRQFVHANKDIMDIYLAGTTGG